MIFPYVKYRNTEIQIHKYTTTKCNNDLACAILLKSLVFKDIKNNVPTHTLHTLRISHASNLHLTCISHASHMHQKASVKEQHNGIASATAFAKRYFLIGTLCEMKFWGSSVF